MRWQGNTPINETINTRSSKDSVTSQQQTASTKYDCKEGKLLLQILQITDSKPRRTLLILFHSPE